MSSDISKIQSIIWQGNLTVKQLVIKENSILLSIENNQNSNLTLEFNNTTSIEIRTWAYTNFHLVGLGIEDICKLSNEWKRN